MTKQVDIPGRGIAILRDPDELRGRDRNLIKAAAMAAGPAIAKLPDEVTNVKPLEGETEEETQTRVAAAAAKVPFTWQESLAMLELRQATVVAVLKEWTLPLPLPTMETIGDLDADLYDALDKAIGGVTAAIANATDFEAQPGKQNPIGSSTSSSASLEDSEVTTPSIPSLPSDGESTSTESSTEG